MIDVFKQFIVDNPAKVLGRIKQTTDRYGNPDIAIIGDVAELEQIDVADDYTPDQGKWTQNIDSSPISTKQLEENIKKSLELTKKEGKGADKAQKKANKQKKTKGYNLALAGDTSQPLFSGKAAFDILNKGLDDETVKVWAWYRNHKGFALDPYLSNFKTTYETAWFDKQLDIGNLCWNPKDNEFQPSSLYYAGNIYDKISEIEKAAGSDSLDENQRLKQLKNLKNILPKPLILTGADNERLVISVLSKFADNFNIYYLDNETTIKSAFKTFIHSLDESEKGTDVNKYHITAYYIDGGRMPNHLDKFEKVEIKRKAALECVYQMKSFLGEIIEPQERERIELSWNRENNGFINIDYDKIPISFSFSKYFKDGDLGIRDAQREGVAFTTVNGTGIIAYDVGVGKTLCAILNVGNALESGLCKRPLIVVPKPTKEKWIGEIRGIFDDDGNLIGSGILPQYQVYDLANLNPKVQKELFDDDGKFKGIPENTISVITYEGMGKIGFSDEMEGEFFMQLKQILNQGFGSESERQKALEDEKLNRYIGIGQEGTVLNIDEAKFDYMVIDEAHHHNKIFSSVKGETSGEGKKRERSNYKITGSQSARAIKAFFLSNYIQSATPYGNICLLTATPFTNNPLEVFNILALTNVKRLSELGLKNITSFFDNYVNQTYEKVIKSDGSIVEAAVIKGWNNKVALQKILFTYMNYKSGEDANISRPEKWTLPKLSEEVDGVMVPLPLEDQITTYLNPTDEQKANQKEISAWLIAQMADQELSKKAPHLVADIKAKKNTISPYVYDGTPPELINPKDFIESSPKLKYCMECVRSVVEWHKKDKSNLSSQVIYINGAVEYLPLIKQYLTEDIGYKTKVHEFKKNKHFDEVEILAGSGSYKRSDEEKEEIKDLFNKGIIKVIIGTSTIREGIDLQKRSSTLYALWIDWNPTDYKQLEGRVWRFGNIYSNVRIVTPLLVGSSDAFTYQKLEEKTGRINDIFDRNDQSNILDVGEEDREAVKWALVDDLAEVAKAKIGDLSNDVLHQISIVNDDMESIDGIDYLVSNINSHKNTMTDIVDRFYQYVEPTDLQKQKIKEQGEPDLVGKAKMVGRQFSKIQDILATKDVYMDYSDRMSIGGIFSTASEYNKSMNKLERLDNQIQDKFGISIYADKEKIINSLSSQRTKLNDELSELRSETYFDKMVFDLTEERKKFNSGIESFSETVDKFKSLNYLLGEVKRVQEQPVKSKKKLINPIEEIEEAQIIEPQDPKEPTKQESLDYIDSLILTLDFIEKDKLQDAKDYIEELKLVATLL